MIVRGTALAAGAYGFMHGGAVAQDGTPAATPVATPVGTPATTPVASGEWTFTDDKGVTVTLPTRPERLAIDVNAAAPLWDYGIRPAALFGWNVNGDGSLTDAGGNVDVSTVELVGNVTEPIQVEALTAVDPDLVITITWSPDDPTEYWSIDTDALGQIGQRYPVIALSATGQADRSVDRFAQLAVALGADLATPEQQAAKTAYQAKITDVRAAITAKPDLTFLFLSLGGEAIYLASAQDWGDLTFYEALGLQIPTVGAQPLDYWTEISREELGAYPSDVMFQSTRPATLTGEEIAADPVFRLHPAVAAGQIFPWNQDFILSYQGMTVALETVLRAVQSANKVT